ncbi:MAG: molybdate ABC transporter substrate-binding protein [Gammaproteobacteria bacterium]|nr:molybdate ABC transporter substrate-binding protein [Gammaproteobacteria bacterium]
MNLPLRLLLLPLFFLPIQTALGETARIAVAANFTDVTYALASLFEQQTGHTVTASFGSTGKLYAQIVHGAPFDLFLAADAAQPRRLESDGLAVAGSRFTYARGRLVLWSAQPELFTDGVAFLRRGEFRRLAIANPQTAPYGAAARQLLQRLGVWPALSAKLVRGDSIAQAFQFTATGNAELGLVAASQVRAWARPGSIWLVPESMHQPIVQQAVLLRRGEESVAAQDFMRFLRGSEARTVIRDHGYAVE